MDVLLDAAAFVPTSGLDLSVVKPEFVAISFYKMFGYPTGIGALIIRKAVFQKLKRPWFAGGTVNFADVYRFMHFAAGFRDKTNMNIGEVTFDIQSCRAIRDGS